MKEMRASMQVESFPILRRAEVLSIESGDVVWVRYHDALAEEVVPVELAIAQYEPAVGDWLLVTETPAERYALGVVGAGRRRVPQGAHDELHVRAARRIILDAPSVEVRALTLELDATTVTERSESSYRITGDAHQSSRRMRTLVEGDCETVAGRVSIAADEDTRIDGRRVLLG